MGQRYHFFDIRVAGAKVFAGDRQTAQASGIWMCAQGDYVLREEYTGLFDDQGVA